MNFGRPAIAPSRQNLIGCMRVSGAKKNGAYPGAALRARIDRFSQSQLQSAEKRFFLWPFAVRIFVGKLSKNVERLE